jgi:hypothetical protein
MPLSQPDLFFSARSGVRLLLKQGHAGQPARSREDPPATHLADRNSACRANDALAGVRSADVADRLPANDEPVAARGRRSAEVRIRAGKCSASPALLNPPKERTFDHRPAPVAQARSCMREAFAASAVQVFGYVFSFPVAGSVAQSGVYSRWHRIGPLPGASHDPSCSIRAPFASARQALSNWARCPSLPSAHTGRYRAGHITADAGVAETSKTKNKMVAILFISALHLRVSGRPFPTAAKGCR